MLAARTELKTESLDLRVSLGSGSASGTLAKSSPIIVSCSEIGDLNWRFLERHLADTGTRFQFFRAIPKNLLERSIKVLNLARPRASFDAVRAAKAMKADLIVAHGPPLAAWCGFFARLLRTRIPIVAHNFNFTELPSSPKRRVFAWMLARMNRFVVFSTFERTLYAQIFNLPADRFDVVLWGVRPPEVPSPQSTPETGEYVCAIGGNARDYATLLEAARRLPHIPFVLVVRPDSLKTLELPSNLRVHVNCPLPDTMNILLHSRFMVLPLLNKQTACGHVTMVSAMQLGKAFVVTDSAGVRDYVTSGYNGITVPPGSAEALATETEHLWNDRTLCERLGTNGQQFAGDKCTEDRVVAHFRDLLHDAGLIVPDNSNGASAKRSAPAGAASNALS
jgi:glycosyltransferase involved in cell wall biosynthesis